VKEGPGLLDTGPLVSFLASGLRHHSWTCEQWKFFRPPLLTCEPVLTEAAFLLKREGREADPLFALLERGVIRIALNIQEGAGGPPGTHASLSQQAHVPCGCLSRATVGLQTDGEVFTLDSDFRIYRRHGNKVIPVLMP
jgi:uncharacterized protein